MSTQAAAAPQSANPDLKQVHTALVELVQQLEASIAGANSASEVTAILDEIEEVNARVTMAGRQLFTQQTEQIREESQSVLEAADEAKKVAKNLEGVRELVEGITKFLTIVDKLIDTAKLVI